MLNHSDGYIPFFTYLYFCMIVIIGYFYMMQLLLAVIMSNLSKIMAQEEHDDIALKKLLVQKDKEAMKKIKINHILQVEAEKRKSVLSPSKGRREEHKQSILAITPPFTLKISDKTDRPDSHENE